MVLLLNRILQLLKVIKLNTGGNVRGSTFEKKKNFDLHVHYEYSSKNTDTKTER